MFEAKRDAWLKQKEEAKKNKLKPPSSRQKEYWTHLSDSLKASEGKMATVRPFLAKRPAAAADPVTPSPKKGKAKEETPEKIEEPRSIGGTASATAMA